MTVVSGFLAGVSSSDAATGSAVAVAPCIPVALEVAVDPGGHVIQHSAPAGNVRNVNPETGMSTVSRRDFAFMIHPPFVFDFYSRSFSERVQEAEANTARPTALSSSAPQSYLPLFGGMGACKRQIYGCRFSRLALAQTATDFSLRAPTPTRQKGASLLGLAPSQHARGGGAWGNRSARLAPEPQLTTAAVGVRTVARAGSLQP